jgi:hypothetical protein
MEYAGQQVLVNFSIPDKAAAAAGAIGYITRRVGAVLALLTFTYGLLAAEVELAKIEQSAATAAR